MAENTKMPPNQDQRQRNPQGDMNKPQKPGSVPGSGSGSTVNNPDRSRQGSNNPNMDPDRNRVDRGRPGQDPMKPDKDEIPDDDDDLETAQTQRQERGTDDEEP